MAYREVSRVEIAEVVRRWQSGSSQRQIATGTGLSRATVRRYIAAAMGAGLTRDGPAASEEQLSRLSGLNLSSPRKVEAPTEEKLAPWADQIHEWLSSDRLQLTRIQRSGTAAERVGGQARPAVPLGSSTLAFTVLQFDVRGHCESDGDRLELMNDIRRMADVPVIFLSVYGQDEAVARALDMGAADYVFKPFSPTELAARIRAALRKRLEPFQDEPSGPYATEGLGIDYARRRVTLTGSRSP